MELHKNWFWNWKLLAVYIMLSWTLVFSYRHSLGLTTSSQQRQRDNDTMMEMTMTMTTTTQSHSQRNHHIKLTKWVCEYVCVFEPTYRWHTFFSLYIVLYTRIQFGLRSPSTYLHLSLARSLSVIPYLNLFESFSIPFIFVQLRSRLFTVFFSYLRKTNSTELSSCKFIYLTLK